MGASFSFSRRDLTFGGIVFWISHIQKSEADVLYSPDAAPVARWLVGVWDAGDDVVEETEIETLSRVLLSSTPASQTPADL